MTSLAVLLCFGFLFCTVVVVAVDCLCCGLMDLAGYSPHVAVMDLFWGRYRLWPSLLWPLWFVAVIVVPPQHDVSISIARGFAVSEPLVFNSLP